MTVINFLREVTVTAAAAANVAGRSAGTDSSNRSEVQLHAIGSQSMRECHLAGGRLVREYPTWSESLQTFVMPEADYSFQNREQALRLVTRIEQADPAFWPTPASA